MDSKFRVVNAQIAAQVDKERRNHDDHPQTPGDGVGGDWRMRAFELYQEFKGEKLLNLCSRWIEAEPETVIPWIILCKLYLLDNNQKARERAFSEFQRLNAQADEVEQCYNNSVYWATMGEAEAALGWYNEFEKHDAKKADRLHKLITALFFQHLKIQEMMDLMARAEKEGCTIMELMSRDAGA